MSNTNTFFNTMNFEDKIDYFTQELKSPEFCLTSYKDEKYVCVHEDIAEQIIKLLKNCSEYIR